MTDDDSPSSPAEPLADQKIRLEMQRMRREMSPIFRFAPQIVSVAAVVIAASQFWLAWQSNEHQQVNQRNDFLLRCIDAGMKAADYAAKVREEFKAGDEARQIGALNIVLTSLPPHTAIRVLDAIGTESSTPAVLDAMVAAHREALKAATASDVGREPCPTVQYVALLPVPATADVPPSPTSPSVQPTPVQPSTPPDQPAPAQATPPLDVYVQIVRDTDAATARRVIQALGTPPGFPRSFGPDYVPQRDSAAARPEVRFYYGDQKAQAERLAVLLAEAAARAGVAGLDGIRAVQLPARFSKLPRNRIEAWFPQLQPR